MVIRLSVRSIRRGSQTDWCLVTGMYFRCKFHVSCGKKGGSRTGLLTLYRRWRELDHCILTRVDGYLEKLHVVRMLANWYESSHRLLFSFPTPRAGDRLDLRCKWTRSRSTALSIATGVARSSAMNRVTIVGCFQSTTAAFPLRRRWRSDMSNQRCSAQARGSNTLSSRWGQLTIR